MAPYSKNYLPIFGSHYGYKKTLAKHVLIGYGSILRNKPIDLPEDVIYSSGHNIWSGGYFHWITESLTRLVAVRRSGRDCVPIVPPSKKFEGVYRESLKAIGFAEIKVMPDNSYMRVPRYLLPENPKEKATFSPELILEVRKEVLGRCGLSKQTPWRRVYVSRAKSRGRFLENEQDLLNEIQGLGFEVHYFDEMSFKEQVEIMSETRTLLSVHGAGLTNIIFMQPGSSVVELMVDPKFTSKPAAVRDSKMSSPTYCRLASVCGVDYYAVFGDAVLGLNENLPNIRIDAKEVSVTLNMALK